MKRAWLIFSLHFFLITDGRAQSETKDSCNKLPYYKAFIDGVGKIDTLSFEQARRINKLVPENNLTSIIEFSVVLDCESCQPIEIKAAGDTIPEKDWRLLTKYFDGRAKSFLIFNCIIGKDVRGNIISYLPFMFYLKQ
jgi:hypothetical protein